MCIFEINYWVAKRSFSLIKWLCIKCDCFAFTQNIDKNNFITHCLFNKNLFLLFITIKNKSLCLTLKTYVFDQSSKNYLAKQYLQKFRCRLSIVSSLIAKRLSRTCSFVKFTKSFNQFLKTMITVKYLILKCLSINRFIQIFESSIITSLY